MQYLIDFLLTRRLLLAALTVVFAGLLSWGMNYSSIDSSYRSILSEDDPYKAEVDQGLGRSSRVIRVLFEFADPFEVLLSTVLKERMLKNATLPDTGKKANDRI